MSFAISHDGPWFISCFIKAVFLRIGIFPKYLAKAIGLNYNVAMMIIYTAMYHEAKPLIEHFRLQRVHLRPPAPGRLQWFSGSPERFPQPIHVVIGGTGSLAAAVGTTYALTRLTAGGDMTSPDDPISPPVFLNVGIAGSRRTDWPVGEAVLCHKIIHHDTDREYYPDILIAHPFSEGTLETFSKPVIKPPIGQVNAGLTGKPAGGGKPEQNLQLESKEAHLSTGGIITGDLADMEGAGCFEAAAAFLPPHQLFFVKVVSDHLDLSLPENRPSHTRFRENNRPARPHPAILDGETVTRLVAEHLPKIEKLLLDITEMVSGTAAPLLHGEEERLIRVLSDHLRLTATMSRQFRELCLQYKAGGGHDLAEQLVPWLDIPVQNKQQRNAVFAQIRRSLLPS